MHEVIPWFTTFNIQHLLCIHINKKKFAAVMTHDLGIGPLYLPISLIDKFLQMRKINFHR